MLRRKPPLRPARVRIKADLDQESERITEEGFYCALQLIGFTAYADFRAGGNGDIGENHGAPFFNLFKVAANRVPPLTTVCASERYKFRAEVTFKHFSRHRPWFLQVLGHFSPLAPKLICGGQPRLRNSASSNLKRGSATCQALQRRRELCRRRTFLRRSVSR